MKRAIIVFCLALGVVIFSGAPAAFAQNGADRILVAGRQPLRQSEVDRMIEFFEWAFETEFTGDERGRYRAMIVDEFRQNAAEGRQNVDVLINALAKVRANDAAAQAQLRRMFVDDYVKDLRAATDEGSQMMLAIYERGQTGGASKAGAADADEPVQSSKSSANAGGGLNLVGKWFRTVGGPRGDDGTGKTTYQSGIDYTFEFFADGTMRFVTEKKVLSIMQCRITENTNITGTYAVAGDQLTMNLAGGTSAGTNSCESSGNFKKTLTASTMKQSFVIKRLESVFRPDKPLVVCFDGAASDDDCFERVTR